MTGHLWIDPQFGVSGDMMLGCLVGLGASLPHITGGLESLQFSSDDQWSLTESTVTRNSLSACRVTVETNESHHHRTWSSIDDLLAGAAGSRALSDFAVNGARATFRLLGETEARMHNVAMDEVHFHEVGAMDAIFDIVGAWLALESLRQRFAITTVGCGPIGLGHGSVAAAHGLLPIPAPATSALLVGAPVIPVGASTGAAGDVSEEDSPSPADASQPAAGETVTPTGAALLATMVDRWDRLPEGRLTAVARGAGGRNPDGYPNVTTGYVVQSEVQSEAVPPEPGGSRVTQTTTAVLETNLDDVTPEVVAFAIDRCLEAGADDAWAQPIVMKKGRPAVALSVMCPPALADQLRDLIMAETGTLGIRRRLVTKEVAERSHHPVMVDGHQIGVKVGPHHAKPEFDDLAVAARALNRPLRDVADQARDALNRLSQCPDNISPDIERE